MGKDEARAEMKLSDFRGKVVVLVFWADWCGSCMKRVPAERALVARMKGRPFVLLGVNSDPPEQLGRVIEKNRINWRSWADGPRDGPLPIATRWNVSAWPAVYVIDAAGVIRYSKLEWATGHELDDAVEALVKEQEKAAQPGG